MFDYEAFENNVLQQMERIFDQWTTEQDDIYIFSLDCAMGMESIGVMANTTHYLEEQAEPADSDYWFYKYCEEEWELSHWFQGISEEMNQYLLENESSFSDPGTFEYTEAFDEHGDKIVECCEKALIRFRRSLDQKRSNVMLTFYIRDYFDEEGRIEIFEKINSESAVKEYSEHIGDFV